MKKIIIGLVALSSISTFAETLSYSKLIEVSTVLTAELSGFSKSEVEKQVAESIYKNLGHINDEGEVVLESLEGKSSYYLSTKASSVCTELYGHRDACRGQIRLALKNIIKD